ncbi:type II secretion system protein GspL [Propionivibrio dicarboxylicus]|uniref:Type II secretion system protein L n=1 Tax=Propionivibrio dicarboxylicus TaxID=83767 RepID=A0A1G8AL39_9RHOO|nr:type II secretion system protein GspL [Propionivibrio dicarboxylicus]SDH21563.1 type II secretion system protein L [Propionivibrio dicarboxylicus]
MSSPRQFSRLRLILTADPSQDSVRWLGFGDGQAVPTPGEDSPANLPSADAIELILPPARISLHRLTLPARAGKHLDALVSQTMEDRLLGDRGDTLFLIGRDAEGQRHVGACSRTWLASVLDRLSAVGVIPERLLPAYALLPEDEHTVVSAPIDDKIIFRTPEGHYGVVRDESSLQALRGDATLRFITDVYRQDGSSIVQFHPPRTLVRSARPAFDRSAWHRSATLLALSLLLFIAATTIHWRQLERRERLLSHEIRQTFAAAFPGTPIIDPALQWESKQREQSGTRADALDALALLAGKLPLPLQPRHIEADEAGIRLTVSDAALARYKEQLDALGHPEITPAGPGLVRVQFRGGQ